MAATTTPATRNTRRPAPKTTKTNLRPLRADVVAAVRAATRPGAFPDAP